MKPKTLRVEAAWRIYADWLQQAAALRAEMRELDIPIPAALDGASHKGPAPWKTAEPFTSDTKGKP